MHRTKKEVGGSERRPTMCCSKRLVGQIILAVLLAAIALLAIPVCSQQEPPSRLVNAEWLEQTLTREDLRIIDVRENIKDYWQGHIPGAVYLSPDALRLADHGVPGMLMPPEALINMLGEMGVREKTTVIVYAEQNDFKAPYLIWALDYLRHPSAAMLEGGFEKWQKEERPLTQDYPRIAPTSYPLSLETRREVRATLEEVKQVVKDGSAILLDVRPLPLYSGEKGFWKRKGHIKGAIHHFWGDDQKEDGSWKSREALKAAYEKLGATPDKTIITYCGQGQMAAHTYFTLKYVLGYPKVKNYDGSFSQWSNIDELPVETGVPLTVE
jgi:thiosulfate/3-mercaptopyruvate sulfurtransferase